MAKIMIIVLALLLSGCDLIGSAVLQATTNTFPLLWN